MPPLTFTLLILSVITAAGGTIALAFAAGVPVAALGIAALLGALALRLLWRRQ